MAAVNEHIVIITGSAPLAPAAVDGIPENAIVLGVDGGLDHALAAGLHPSGLIGDLDSITDEGLAWAREHATVASHPPDKDETDTELALAFAADMNPDRITMLGAGDRLDHGIAALGALGAPSLTNVPTVDAWWGDQHIEVIHGPERRTLHLQPGSTLSLLALHGPVSSVSITGVRWPLDDHDLAPVVGLGISNVVLDGPAEPDDQTGDSDRPTAGTVELEITGGVLTVFDSPVDDAPVHDLDRPSDDEETSR